MPKLWWSDRVAAGFGVYATGAPPLSYQWYRDGAAIGGANGVELELALVGPADSGAKFSVVVSNAAGTATSEVATLTVQDAALLQLVRHAGVLAGAGNAGGDALATARFNTPLAVVGDALGNIFVADTFNGVIRRIDSTAMSAGRQPGREGAPRRPWRACMLPHRWQPFSRCALFVADWNHTVRVVHGAFTAAPLVATIAGRANDPGAVDGTGEDARFNGPSALAFDSNGMLYVADEASHLIRRIDPATRQVSTYAGQRFVAGADDGHRSVARFRNPRGLFVGGVDQLLVADTGNHTVRMIDPLGQVSTIAGKARESGYRNGRAAEALFSSPTAALQLADGIYVADSGNHVIRKALGGFVETVAGTGVAGIADGQRLQAQFNTPTGFAVAGGNRLLVADLYNHAIRELYRARSQLPVKTLAGQKPQPGATDGFWSAASFNRPAGLASDATGGLWVADAGNHLLRRIATGRVSTLAGQAGSGGAQDGAGAQARLDEPAGIAFDAAGSAWVTQRGAVRRVDATGNVVTLATAASSGGLLSQPQGIVILDNGDAVVADRATHRLLRISPTGVVSVFAGSGSRGGADGAGVSASFDTPLGLALDRVSGLLYAADSRNHVIRVVTSLGVVSTWAGATGQRGSADGLGAAARLREPSGVSVGRGGNVYVADRGNHKLRRISPAGQVTTIAGQAGIAGFIPGLLPGLLARPAGIVAAGSSLFVTMEDGVVELRDYP